MQTRSATKKQSYSKNQRKITDFRTNSVAKKVNKDKMAEGGNKQTETELFSEALQELPRNDDLKRMLIEIIDARINPINESLANIDEKMTKFEKIESDIGVMKKQLSEKTKKLTVDIEQNKRNIQQTEEKLLRLDLQRRQTNLIIDNIEQKGGENVIKTVETCLGNIGC
ncbi:unnamed protein product, partial [Owenia fusiformis]